MVKGQVVAITGASSGIGKATALELARLGAKLMLGARHEEALLQVAEEIRAAGGEAVYRITDVSRREDLLKLVHLAQETFGQLDVLFSNAGAMPIGPFDELAVDDWETMVDVNIKGVLFGIAAALPVFRQQGSGHFIHTASTAARKTVPNQVVYSATKAAVLALSDGLRQELAGQIRVSTILPGFTDTAFSEHVKNPEMKAQMQKAGEKFAMSPETVARAVVYILEQPEGVNIGEVTLRSKAQA
ncbi:SDR family oxidoreductase [Tunturiibacter empetritectus]|uniref:NADP-dependent 3-hydroxy acid dehydrogenase YdfG n=2 Tax=Tunturiibacter TaxID=3154218 RepID=A0A852VLU9_9BACT|nr:SDR family oxidoreductase [Edaphobacter lichenicola]NYF92269.1 NADP-dependent 3-hydroxy acid dehydrogenase YdfG [Edaphobacter lichenicola]